MTYTEIEQSVEQGNPIELFEFRAEGRSWKYTSADQHVFMEGYEENTNPETDSDYDLYDGQDVYLSVPMSRSGLEQTNDVTKSDIQINMARDVPIAEVFLTKMPENVMTLTIKRSHMMASELESESYNPPSGDTSNFQSTDFMVVWKGRVISFSFKDDELTINCESVYTSLKRYGLLSKYQYICRHALYSQGPGKCNVDKELYKFTSTVSGIDGFTVTVDGADGQEDGWWIGGFVYFGDYTYRYVTGHTGNEIRLNKKIPSSIEVGASITMYAGCDHSFNTCRDKFDNLLNYGGFPHIPLTNPFADLGNSLV